MSQQASERLTTKTSAQAAARLAVSQQASERLTTKTDCVSAGDALVPAGLRTSHDEDLRERFQNDVLSQQASERLTTKTDFAREGHIGSPSRPPNVSRRRHV